MRRSLTLRIFFVQFLCLALVLMITTCVFFEQFYVNQRDGLEEKLNTEVIHTAFQINGLEPLPRLALQDILLFLPKDLASVKKDMDSLNAFSPANEFSLVTLMPTGGHDYTIYGKLMEGQKVFKSGGDVDGILLSGRGAYLRYIVKPGTPPVLYYFIGSVLDLEADIRTVLLVGRNIEDGVQTIFRSEERNRISLALTNGHGVVLLSSLSPLEGEYFGSLDADTRAYLEQSGALGSIKLASQPLKQNLQDGLGEFTFNKKTYLAYRMQLPDQGYGLIAFAPKHQVFFSALRQFFWIYFVYVVVLIIGVILAYYLSQWISKPLRQLTFVMGKAHAGDLNARCREVPLGYEFNLLGQLFNKTIEGLVVNMRALEEAKVDKELYSKELSVGREVQKSLLAIQVPDNDEVEISATYLSAENVGGDFYTIEKLRDHKYWLCVGDAAGKGVSSCLYALVARSLIRSFAQRYEDVGKLLCETNNAFLGQTGDTGMFVATLTGLYDAQTKKLSYYSCGHTPGIVRRREGNIEMLQHSGMALGLLELNAISADEVVLEEGDIVIFFTKGLIEGINDKYQHFSERRLKNLLQQRKWITPKQLVAGLIEEYRTFIGEQKQEEEVVIVAMQIKSNIIDEK